MKFIDGSILITLNHQGSQKTLKISKYIELNSIHIINFEESMTDIYLRMIKDEYIFTINPCNVYH